MRFLPIVIVCLFVFNFAIGDVYAAGLVPCNGPECNACHFVSLGKNVIDFFIKISAVVVTLVFAIAGMKIVMAGDNSGQISKAKGMMTDSVIGLVIILSSWLIVDTFLKVFINEQKLGPWNEVQCSAAPARTTVVTPKGEAPGTVTISGKMSDADARTLLSQNGISVNKTEAQGTSLSNMNQATVQDIIDLKKGCDCEIVVTGGTEGSGGHAVGTVSHSTGYKYDVRPNTTLDSYITSQYQDVGVRGDGARMYKAPDGVIYAREGDHWDVKVSS